MLLAGDHGKWAKDDGEGSEEKSFGLRRDSPGPSLKETTIELSFLLLPRFFLLEVRKRFAHRFRIEGVVQRIEGCCFPGVHVRRIDLERRHWLGQIFRGRSEVMIHAEEKTEESRASKQKDRNRRRCLSYKSVKNSKWMNFLARK